MRAVLQAPEGTDKMKEIATAIQEGASAYLSRQFRTVAIFLVVLAIAIFFVLPVPANAAHSETSIRLGRSIAFMLGAFFSAVTGYIGMWLAVRANVRTANAARESGLRAGDADRVSLRRRGRHVHGRASGLLGAVAILIIYKGDAASVLVGFGFGGALLAMFMRVGGGIFTKAADVGADLVGKVEQGIPEDDPRNAATIADNVGDNVGDCAGMAADLFESSEVTLIASLILGAAAYAGSPLRRDHRRHVPAVRPRDRRRDLDDRHSRGRRRARRTSTACAPSTAASSLSAFVSSVAVLILSGRYMHSYKPAFAVIIGLVLASVIQVLTQYFTDTKYRPVQEIAEATVTGPATTILSGFSIGLESTVWSALIVGAAMISSYFLGGNDPRLALYFISLTGMGMLTTVGVIVSMDTFGPISDNAQGIAEMSGEFEGRPAEILTGLDAIGNSTKAITKGIAIATAVIAATSLFGSFEEALRIAYGAGYTFPGIRVDRPNVLVGLLIGGCVAFLFSSLAIRAVGRAASQVVVEVRKQFRDHPGIMDYTEKPDYGAVVDICTRTSLRELTTPGLLAVLAPLIAGFFLEAEALGAFLAGAILTGQLLAVMLSNSGGAWDNAKKFIEDGNYGGKGSDSHKAAVIGDTVGDPFKDTAGPALNPMIKVMNLVALLIAPVVVAHADDIALRVAIVVICAAVLGVMIWISKNRSSGLEDDLEQAKTAASVG